MIGFRWRSWLGASAILFLLYGAIDMVSAVAMRIMGSTVGREQPIWSSILALTLIWSAENR